MTMNGEMAFIFFTEIGSFRGALPFLANVNLYAIAVPSVCLSSVTFVHPTHVVAIFGNVSTPYDIFKPCLSACTWITSTSIFGDGHISTHDERASIGDRRHSPPVTASAQSVEGTAGRLSAILAAVRRFLRFWAYERAKFSKMGEFPAQDAPEPPLIFISFMGVNEVRVKYYGYCVG